MILVFSGPNLTLELSTFDLLEKNKFFSRRPSASSKKNLFFSRRPSVKVPKLEMSPERTDIILLKVGFRERFNLCSYLRENKAQTSKTKAES